MTTDAGNDSDLAYADILWKSADALRGQVDAAEYKHVVLGLLFLKYISDSFESRRDALKAELQADGIAPAQIEGLLESRDEYTADWSAKIIPGFCKPATIEEIAKHGHVLTPGRYVGAEDVEDDGEDFAVKYARMVAELEEHFAEGERLTSIIRERLKGVRDGG